MNTFRLLKSNDPAALLHRGYAIVRNGKTIVKDPRTVKRHDSLMIQLAKGELRVWPEDYE